MLLGPDDGGQGAPEPRCTRIKVHPNQGAPEQLVLTVVDEMFFFFRFRHSDKRLV